MRLRRIGLGSLVALALLTACSTPAPRNSTSLSGRWALTVQSEPPSQYSAQFEWQGDAQRGELWLTSPLGSTLAHLSWAPGQARLTQSGRVQSAESPEQLLEALAGVRLPMPTLLDWLQGRPSPLPGWQVDLSGQAGGRLVFTRLSPPPVAQLRLVLDR